MRTAILVLYLGLAAVLMYLGCMLLATGWNPAAPA